MSARITCTLFLLLAMVALPLGACSGGGGSSDRDYRPPSHSGDYYQRPRVVEAANGNYLVTFGGDKRVSFNSDGRVLGQVNANQSDVRRAREILDNYRDTHRDYTHHRDHDRDHAHHRDSDPNHSHDYDRNREYNAGDRDHPHVVAASNGNYLVTLSDSKRVSFDRDGHVLGQQNADDSDVRQARRVLERYQSRH